MRKPARVGSRTLSPSSILRCYFEQAAARRERWCSIRAESANAVPWPGRALRGSGRYGLSCQPSPPLGPTVDITNTTSIASWYRPTGLVEWPTATHAPGHTHEASVVFPRFEGHLSAFGESRRKLTKEVRSAEDKTAFPA